MSNYKETRKEVIFALIVGVILMTSGLILISTTRPYIGLGLGFLFIGSLVVVIPLTIWQTRILLKAEKHIEAKEEKEDG